MAFDPNIKIMFLFYLGKIISALWYWHTKFGTLVFHYEKTCVYIHDPCMTLTFDQYTWVVGVILMSFTHSFYLVFFFKKNSLLPGILQANEETVMMSEEGYIYIWLWSTLKRPYWSYCKKKHYFAPLWKKGAYYFVPVSLSMDQMMSSHIFWPLAWMFPNLIQWKPLRSTWPPLIFRSLGQR